MQVRLDDTIDIQSNPTLFGVQRNPGLVNVSADRKGTLTTYRRTDEGVESQTVENFRPFLWLSDPDLLRGLQVEVECTPLAGGNHFSHLVSASNWSDIKEASGHIADACGHYASHPLSAQLFLNDLPTQYLLATGQTYYNKMALEEVKTLALRVYTETDLLDEPGDDPDRIMAVGLKVSGSDEGLLIEEEDEAKLLWRLRGNLKKIDADLIVGHQLFNRDLDRLNTRCKKHKVKQDFGRDEARLSGRRTRMMVAEKTLDYRRFQLGGVEFADSWILSILHDVSGREMMGYDFEDVTEHFRLPRGGARDSLAVRVETDLNSLLELHRRLIYPYFLQSQIFPLSFENVILRGNATRINHIFLREYYRLGHSIPQKPDVVDFAGGLTAQEHSGCAYGVYHCDVASLYPSLIVSQDLGPAQDQLHIFTGLLETLRDFRLLTKARFKEAENPSESAFFGNLQTTFKILINSFYGYLGFGQGHFADFERAAEVTRQGRELLKDMMAWLKSKGAAILEVDTDGIYFVPSEEFATDAWIDELNTALARGVQIEFDGRYPGMYCHKMKNYALLEDDGNLILRGSGLRSRALEPYLRNFIEDLIRTSLDEGAQAREGVLKKYEEKLKNGKFGVEELAKTETLIDSPTTYAKKIEKGGRNRAAVYELALASEKRYRSGQSISYYVVGDKATVTVYNHCKRVEDYREDEPDVNIKYYVKKLKQTFKKFEPILASEEIRSPIPYSQLPSPTH